MLQHVPDMNCAEAEGGGGSRATSLKKAKKQKSPAAIVDESRALLEQQIFEHYGVTTENIEPAALAKARQHGDEDALHRAARLAATNQVLSGCGLPPLLLVETSASTEAEKKPSHRLFLSAAAAAQAAALDAKKEKPPPSLSPAAEAIGLTAEQEEAIRGNFGSILGLEVDQRAYKWMSAAALWKQALKLRGDEEASLQHMRKRMISHAKMRVNELRATKKAEAIGLKMVPGGKLGALVKKIIMGETCHENLRKEEDEEQDSP